MNKGRESTGSPKAVIPEQVIKDMQAIYDIAVHRDFMYGDEGEGDYPRRAEINDEIRVLIKQLAQKIEETAFAVQPKCSVTTEAKRRGYVTPTS